MGSKRRWESVRDRALIPNKQGRHGVEFANSAGVRRTGTGIFGSYVDRPKLGSAVERTAWLQGLMKSWGYTSDMRKRGTEFVLPL